LPNPAKHDHFGQCFAGQERLIPVLPAVTTPLVPVVAIPVSSLLAARIVTIPPAVPVAMWKCGATGKREQQRYGEQFFHDGLQMFMVIEKEVKYFLRSAPFDAKSSRNQLAGTLRYIASASRRCPYLRKHPRKRFDPPSF
jgi:hypothetical protein